ncbi:hypothetical protein BH18CHL2_BH18CHL2_10510 [soil metagenome]
MACLDTNVVVKYLVPEDRTADAIALVRELTRADTPLVAPSLCWAEVGSVLKKKADQRQIQRQEADVAWARFLDMPIVFLDELAIREHAWNLAARYGLPTLHDAAFLACVETASRGGWFWTADRDLLRRLEPRPAYVRELGA